MDSRKLISFGSSSYVVSLPKSWVDHNKLHKGDSIFIEERPNELLITIDSSDKEKEIREKKIDAYEKSLKRIESEIVAAYLGTYDIIEVRNIESENSEKIKGILQNFAGLEILEQTSNKIVARDLINLNEVSMKTLIRRIDIILRSMLDDVFQCCAASNGTCSIQMQSRDMDVNRLSHLISRIAIASLKEPKLLKKFNTTAIEVMSELDLANSLERIGDHIKRFSRHIEDARKDDKYYKEVCAMIKSAQDRYFAVMKAYYSRDVTTAFDIETSSVEECQKCNALMLNGSSKHIAQAATHLRNFLTSVRYVARAIILSNS